MKKLSVGKKAAGILLAVICLIQLAVSLDFGSQKSFLMCDELFTYGAANYDGGIMMEFPLNDWKNCEVFMEYVTPGENAFSYEIPYENQSLDVHPPLYYYLIHTISSFNPYEFSYWTGVGLNIVLFLGCTVALYFLVYELVKSRGCALMTCLFYALSYGGLNTMLFIRMYMLFALALLLHLLVYIRYWEREKIPVKGYVFLGLTLVLGAMTQYYFLIAAFFLGVWYTFKLLFGKRFRELGIYLGTIAASAAVSLSLFSPMWDQIFHGSRGTQAQNKFWVFEGYPRALLNMFDIISDQMFRGYLWPVLGVIVLLIAVFAVRFRRLPIKESIKMFPIIFMSAGYFLLVTKIAPEVTDRYMMPLFPVVLLLAFCFLYVLIYALLPAKKQLALAMCTVFGLFLCMPTLKGTVPSYSYNWMKEHTELMKQYSDKKAVYIDREFYWWEYYDLIQVMKENSDFYVISYARIIQDEIDSALEYTAEDEEVIVYVGNTQLDEEITEYIKNTVKAKEMVLLDQFSRYTVYRAIR